MEKESLQVACWLTDRQLWGEKKEEREEEICRKTGEGERQPRQIIKADRVQKRERESTHRPRRSPRSSATEAHARVLIFPPSSIFRLWKLFFLVVHCHSNMGCTYGKTRTALEIILKEPTVFSTSPLFDWGQVHWHGKVFPRLVFVYFGFQTLCMQS